MIKQITEYLMAWAERNNRVFKITGTAGPEDVYLIRYYIVKSRWFNFFIHQFLRSDRDDLHDHPWHFCTYLVSGGYRERKWNPRSKQIDETVRLNVTLNEDLPGHAIRYKKNVFVFRRATDQHQVVVDTDLPESEKHLAATTLFFSGPTIREWGFWRQTDGERFWVPWRKYLGLPDDAPGRG